MQEVPEIKKHGDIYKFNGREYSSLKEAIDAQKRYKEFLNGGQTSNETSIPTFSVPNTAQSAPNRPFNPVNGPPAPVNRPFNPVNGPPAPVNRPFNPVNGPPAPVNRPFNPVWGPTTPSPVPDAEVPAPRPSAPVDTRTQAQREADFFSALEGAQTAAKAGDSSKLRNFDKMFNISRDPAEYTQEHYYGSSQDGRIAAVNALNIPLDQKVKVIAEIKIGNKDSISNMVGWLERGNKPQPRAQAVLDSTQGKIDIVNSLNVSTDYKAKTIAEIKIGNKDSISNMIGWLDRGNKIQPKAQSLMNSVEGKVSIVNSLDISQDYKNKVIAEIKTGNKDSISNMVGWLDRGNQPSPAAQRYLNKPPEAPKREPVVASTNTQETESDSQAAKKPEPKKEEKPQQNEPVVVEKDQKRTVPVANTNSDESSSQPLPQIEENKQNQKQEESPILNSTSNVGSVIVPTNGNNNDNSAQSNRENSGNASDEPVEIDSTKIPGAGFNNENREEALAGAQGNSEEKRQDNVAHEKALAAQSEAEEKKEQALVLASAKKQSAKEARLKKIMEMRRPYMGGAASVNGNSDAMVVPPITPASQVPPPPLP